ncbi:ankyrin repeat domain-containing protein 66-like [Asterias rubens]|uniref:ankyrin repeat domain-containing protein 66-like n=1 Tax=Asterias rubens TaxID=7604 RepID=UPI001455A61D|nr:ankyrin repeat domain-containing protein 66-like [Asterias rubens]
MEGPIMSEVHEAAAAGDSEQILNLLNLGKYDVNQKDAEWHDRTPLHWAAIKGHGESIRVLVDYGANIDAVTDSGWTPAHFSAELGKIGALKTLHKLGANIEIKDCCGDTARDVAAVYGQHDCVEFLKMAAWEDVIRKEREQQEKLDLEERERQEEEKRRHREEEARKQKEQEKEKKGKDKTKEKGKKRKFLGAGRAVLLINSDSK